jgi:formylglycine-generating enzyme required for sulfatase activity
MPDAATHPTPQELMAFARGRLPEAAAAAVAGHLEACPACQKAVEKLPTDSFLGKVRAAKPGSSSLPPGPSPARAGVAPSVLGQPAALPAPPAGLLPELAGYAKYRFVRELGRGGMGVVYLAEQTLMGRTVAVKVINPSVLAHPDALPRFHAEVRAAARLDHPHIVRAFDAEQVGDLHLLVMEFVEGMSLADLVQHKGPQPVPHACHYVRQAALGLQHAFEQGMAHRDVKPHNLMVTPRGVVKILDFGLARLRGPGAKGGGLTQVDSFMGTPEYVSPEQATDARTADTRADIYSLGCTLYFVLTGRPPFVEDTVVKLVLAQIEKEPTPLHEVRPDVPAGLSAVVARMLAKDPARRYQTPLEVAQALAAFVKPRARREAGAGPAAAPGVGSAKAGTVMGGDPSKLKGLPQKEQAGKAPPRESAGKQAEAANPFADLAEGATAPKKAGPAPKAGRPAAWYRRRSVLAAIGAAVAALGLGTWLLAGLLPAPKRSGGGSPEPPPPAPEVTNSIGMKLALIPAGKFLMGSPPDEKGRGDDEEQHEVQITRPFYMGIHEVTQAQYEQVKDANPAFFTKGHDGGPDHPVESVSWQDAKDFCAKLSALGKERAAKRVYRLPTEAEWEYACRGGARENTPFHFGTSLSSTQANFNGNFPFGDAAKGRSLEGTTPVGSYPPNGFGLFDMHGNVWEWCADGYDKDYYRTSPKKDPQMREKGAGRVLRGGSWRNYGGNCRAANRYWNDAGHADNVGFRVVCVPAARTP